MIGTKTRDEGMAEGMLAACREALGALRVPRFSAGRFAFVTLITGGLIEALLLARIWLQITDHAVDAGMAGLVYRYSNVFVSPFAGLEPSVLIKNTGIVQVSALVAIDFYLVLTLVSVLFIFWGSQLFGLFSRRLAPAPVAEEPIRLPAATRLAPEESAAQ